MCIFVCIDGRIVVRANVAIQRKLAEERSHAACDTRHRTEGSEHHGLDMGMRVEGRVDAFFAPYFVVFPQNGSFQLFSTAFGSQAVLFHHA